MSVKKEPDYEEKNVSVTLSGDLKFKVTENVAYKSNSGLSFFSK